MMKLIIALFLLILVSALAVGVFEEKKIIAQEVKGNLLELLEESESLRRQITMLWRINIIIIILTIVSTFFGGFYLKCKQNVFLHHIEENQPSPTDVEVRELADQTRDEKVNNKLTYSKSSLIGLGNHGTSVYRGNYDGHVRAIKRLLRTHHSITQDEIQLLINVNDQNVIRCFGYKNDKNFTFIVLEECDLSLKDLIQIFLDSDTNERKKYFIFQLENGFHLWKADGNPSVFLITLIKGILSGLKYLHKSKILHCDLKPSNVLILIKNKISIPKLSDMRVSKLLVDKCYVSPHVTDYGTSAWKAPGLLLHGQHDTSVDLFSLGCLIFFCITKGKHPFGQPIRDANIENDKADLFIIDHMPEAYDLISKLLNHNPSKRLNVEQALKHPFFWDLDFKMEFISIVSDTIEVEWTKGISTLENLVDKAKSKVFGNNWTKNIDHAILNHHQKAGQGGKYNHSSLAALLRLMRNSRSHFIELSKDVDLSKIVGSPKSDALFSYFFNRFPNLLMKVYFVVCQNHPYNINQEFQKYIEI